MDAKETVIGYEFFAPLGAMNKDANYRQINYDRGGNYTGGKDYVDAQNVNGVSLVQQGDQFWYAVNGNVLAITPPTIVEQNKIFSISFANTVGDTLGIQFLNLNGSEFQVNVDASFGPTTGNLVNDTNSWAAVIASALTAGGWTFIINHAIPGTITIELIANSRVTGFDYQIVPDSIDTVTLNIITIQESWDASVAGMCFPTGSKDWLGDLFIESSSVGKDPITFDIVGTQASLGNDVQVNIPGDVMQYITAFGQAVSVSGVEGTTEANGVWINSAASYNVIVPGQTTVTLYNSNYVHSYTGGGFITVNIYGFSNISVSQQNVDTQVWTTWNLLQTKQINSRYNHPYRDEDADSAAQVTNLYFTDNNDYPRTFSYTGPYMTNGAIKYYNPLGEYTYEDVDESTRNIIGVPMPLVTVAATTFTGGAVPSGNWRYTVSLQTSTLVSSGTGIFSNPVNIYNAIEPGISMGTPGINSSMTVTVNIAEIPEGFAYVNLIGINYNGESEVAYLIKTEPIPAGASSMQITHTGLEQGIENYGSGFSLPSIAYVKAGTQCISNGTLLYGDLTATEINDYTAASQTFTHILGTNKTALKPTGDYFQNPATLGEYQIPVATSGFTGHMLNETYRFWLCYELNSGVFTPLFWCDDIRFDLNAINVANPLGQTGRRTGNNITSYDLSDPISTTTGGALNSYVFYVTLQAAGINNYLINGTPLGDLVKRIHIFRTDNTVEGLNEVLASGLNVRNAQNGGSDADLIISSAGSLFDNPFLVNDVGCRSGEVPATRGNTYNTYTYLFGGEPNGYQYGTWGIFGATMITAYTPYSCSFYSPDWIYSQVAISYESSQDTLLEYGQPVWNTGTGTGSDMYCVSQKTVPPSTGTNYMGTEIQLSGSTGKTQDAYTYYNLGLQQAVPIGNFVGQVPSLLVGVPVYNTNWNASGGNGGGGGFSTPAHLWLYTSTPIPTSSLSVTAPDIGTHYAQYYKNLGSVTAYTSGISKFGDITTGTGIPCGAHIDITPESDNVSVDVYGGDTFNQKSFLKILYPDNEGNATQGGGVTVMFFCQNRMNFNMRNPQFLAYPQTPPINGWINWTYQFATEIDDYDPGYTPRNPDNTLGAFNPALPNQTYYPDRKIFSQTKPQGSTINNFRVFPPLNFNDDQTNKGNITALVVVDEELFVLQPKAFWRHFYNDVGTFQGEGTGDVTLGSSAPFSKPPRLVSNNGCSNIFSVIQGKGLQGEDVACWWDTINKKIMMYSRNGLRDISTENNMRSFIFNNIQYVTGDVPIMQNAISGVFDEKRKEFIWTVYNVNTGLEAWNGVDVDYFVGNIATYGTTFEGLPAAWICTANNFDKQPDINPNYWKPYTQAYTIAYNLYANDGKGGFNTFYTPKPYFYAQWKDTYLSAYPNTTTNPFNGMYLSDVGSELVWYNYSETNQTDVGTLTYVNNKDRQRYKQYFNLEVNSYIAPYLMNFTTEEYASFLNSGEFNNLDGILWRAQIKNDTLTSSPPGNNNQWTSPVKGAYMISMLTFLAGQGQKVSSFVTKYINRLKY